MVLRDLDDLLGKTTDELKSCKNRLDDLEKVENISGDVITDIEGDITTIEGDITTIEGDITTIEGDITTIEGDITTLQNDVNALEASFNNGAYQGIISALQFLPALRGLWVSSLDESGDVYDFSEQGRKLTNPGPALVGLDDRWPYLQFDGSNDYLYRGDEAGLDISGAESFVESAYQGLTAGGVFRFDDLSGANNMGVLGRWKTTGNQRSWLLYLRDTTQRLQAVASDNGTSTVMSIASSKVLGSKDYYFCVFRFVPSTSLDVWVNDTKDSDTAGTLIATLFNTSAQFNVMAYNDGAAANRNQGREVFSFLCAAALSDDLIELIYANCAEVFGLS